MSASIACCLSNHNKFLRQILEKYGRVIEIKTGTNQLYCLLQKLVEIQGARRIERLLLLRSLLLRGASGEATGAERWVAPTLWHALQDDPRRAALVASDGDALLHDVIKHQPTAVAGLLDALRSAVSDRSLVRDERRALPSVRSRGDKPALDASAFILSSPGA